MKFSIIIGNSRIDETRQRNLEAVVEFYKKQFPGSQIIITDQIVDKAADAPNGCDYIPIKTNRPYSRSLSFNLGIPHAKRDWLICADNDCIMSSQTVEQIRLGVLNRVDMYVPYRYALDLTEGQTVSFIAGGKVSGAQPRTWNGKAIINYGGISIISKKAFERVGGFDPQFWGWGGEDHAFYGKCSKLLVTKRSTFDMYHLNHHRVHKRAHNPEADKNRKEAHRIFDMSVNEMKQYINNLGNLHYTTPEQIDKYC
jgi:hypothetical protein